MRLKYFSTNEARAETTMVFDIHELATNESETADPHSGMLLRPTEAVRYALDHALGLSNGQKWAVEKHLKSLKLKKMPPGISKASSELGHSDIRTTKKFYDHTVVSDDEFLATLE
jgi:hypothetical protein